MLRFLCCLLLIFLPGAARANWYEASSEHFVVLADDDARNVQRFSEQLERFHATMTRLLEIEMPRPSPSGRVTVYVVRSDAQVRKLIGDKTGQVYAFYIPRAGGSIAVVPTVDAGQGELEFSMIALLHEYAHHITLSNVGVAMPAWMVEGVAEFFASAKFNDDGSMEIGRPAMHRGGELFLAKNVSINQLLEPDMRKRASQRVFDNFYGRSWLLYHYLAIDKARAGQLNDYLLKFNQGMGSIEAAKAAFGDLSRLDQELDNYMTRKTMLMVKMPAVPLPEDAVKLRRLSAGEAAIMPVRLRSKRGVNHDQALALLPEARKVAQSYPDDPAVLAALAEAEHDAGNYDLAVAAADKALAIDPGRVDAFVQKGYALFARASEQSEPAAKSAAFEAAVKPFLDLNKIENDHPLPLAYFYRRYVEQGRQPNKTAVAALARAVELAPFDLGLRMTLATQQLRDGDRQSALSNFRPIAYNPHGGEFSSRVRQLIERVVAGATKEELFKDGKLDLGEPLAAEAQGS